MRRGNNPIDISERDEESDNLQVKALLVSSVF